MPWTRTTAYPQAFMVPAFEMGPSFNYSTYVLFDNILWRATAGQINRWRKRHLALPSTDMSSLSISKVPFLYNFSPAVVPKPLDWHDEISVTGYWNLEDSDADWSPPPALEAFITQAKTDGKPLVYIGFGSIVVPKPAAMTRSITAAVEKGRSIWHSHTHTLTFSRSSRNNRQGMVVQRRRRGRGRVPDKLLRTRESTSRLVVPQRCAPSFLKVTDASRLRNAPRWGRHRRCKSPSRYPDSNQTLVRRSVFLGDPRRQTRSWSQSAVLANR